MVNFFGYSPYRDGVVYFLLFIILIIVTAGSFGKNVREESVGEEDARFHKRIFVGHYYLNVRSSFRTWHKQKSLTSTESTFINIMINIIAVGCLGL